MTHDFLMEEEPDPLLFDPATFSRRVGIIVRMVGRRAPDHHTGRRSRMPRCDLRPFADQLALALAEILERHVERLGDYQQRYSQPLSKSHARHMAGQHEVPFDVEDPQAIDRVVDGLLSRIAERPDQLNCEPEPNIDWSKTKPPRPEFYMPHVNSFPATMPFDERLLRQQADWDAAYKAPRGNPGSNRTAKGGPPISKVLDCLVTDLLKFWSALAPSGMPERPRFRGANECFFKSNAPARFVVACVRSIDRNYTERNIVNAYDRINRSGRLRNRDGRAARKSE